MALVREEPPPGDGGPAAEFDSVDAYVTDRAQELDADVLQGIRELDNADGIKWSVSRVGDEDANRNGFLAKIGTSQLSAEYIRNKFGSGRYYIRGNYPNGKYAAHRTFEIAADAPRTALNVNGTATASAPAGAFDVGKFLAEQEMREEARSEKRRRERNELLALIIPAVSPIVAAMIGRQGPDLTALVGALKGPTMPEMMAGLASLKALVPEQTTDPFDRAMKIMDMIQDKTGGPSAGETGWFDLGKELIKAVGPTLGPAIEARLQASGATPALLSAPSSGVPAADSSATDASTDSTQGNPQMFAQLVLLPWLKNQLGMAIEKAKKHSDPSLIAERILDDLPTGVAPEHVAQLLSRADWWEQLQGFAPAVAPHRAWFTQMRDAMLAEVLDTETAPPPQPAMRVTEKPAPPTAPIKEVSPDAPVEMPGAPPKLGV